MLTYIIKKKKKSEVWYWLILITEKLLMNRSWSCIIITFRVRTKGYCVSRKSFSIFGLTRFCATGSLTQTLLCSSKWATWVISFTEMCWYCLDSDGRRACSCCKKRKQGRTREAKVIMSYIFFFPQFIWIQVQ